MQQTVFVLAGHFTERIREFKTPNEHRSFECNEMSIEGRNRGTRFDRNRRAINAVFLLTTRSELDT